MTRRTPFPTQFSQFRMASFRFTTHRARKQLPGSSLFPQNPLFSLASFGSKGRWCKDVDHRLSIPPEFTSFPWLRLALVRLSTRRGSALRDLTTGLGSFGSLAHDRRGRDVPPLDPADRAACEPVSGLPGNARPSSCQYRAASADSAHQMSAGSGGPESRDGQALAPGASRRPTFRTGTASEGRACFGARHSRRGRTSMLPPDRRPRGRYDRGRSRSHTSG